ncbi:MAG TPA: B12-binding domain-containing protein, partial [Clostridia bacterium]|nr:B12-binding domain-containing protein [Clostridia bacterium]
MITREAYEAYMGHLLTGDRAACVQLASGLVEDGVGTKELYTELFQRALYAVGDLWEGNRISVATEHPATA